MSEFTEDSPRKWSAWGVPRDPEPPSNPAPDATAHDAPDAGAIALGASNDDQPTAEPAGPETTPVDPEPLVAASHDAEKPADEAPDTPSDGTWRSGGVVWPTVTTPPQGTPSTATYAAQPTEQGFRRSRQWVGVAVVAALVGGVIGASIGWAMRETTSRASLTLLQSTDKAGPAYLASGASIPALVKAVSPSVVSIDVKTSFGEDQGTGMIISKGGLVVTNNHVIAAADNGAGTITVTRTGTTDVLSATLLGTDPANDVALLKIVNAHKLAPVTFGNSESLVVGDGVVAIGNALGLAAGTPTVTQGIISALGRTVTAGSASNSSTETLYHMIQTDAAINPGNSGGPLIDTAGHVVGMNTAVAGATSDGTSAQNIGFAIPAQKIEQLLPSLLRGGGVTHRHGAFLGVYISTVTPAMVAARHLTVDAGAYVVRVTPGLPAEKAGLQAGDVIVSIAGQQVASNTDVSSIMKSLKPGQSVSIEVVRGAQHLTYTVTVTAPPS